MTHIHKNTSEGLRIQLAACTSTLLGEIRNPKMKRRDVAKTYALALRSSEKTDWQAVNKAIIERWSLSALEWIKKMAWSGKAFDEVRQPAERP